MAAFAWILCLFTAACTISLAEGYSCWYDDSYGYRHYLYCPYNDCCGSSSYRYCCSYMSTGGIAGAVIGSIVFIVIIVSIVSCCCCACCPVYQHRSGGTVYTTVQPVGPNYQTIPTSTGTYQPTDPTIAKPAGAYTAPPPYQV